MRHLKSIILNFVLFTLLGITIEAIIPDRAMNVIYIIIISVVLLGVLLVVSGTILKNRWGINLAAVNCPRCGITMPRVRKPSSRNQALWGGGTCETCGCNMDKWGRETGSAL